MQKQPPSEPTPEEIQEISQLITEAQDFGEQATSYSAMRLKQCVTIGDRLRAFKVRVGHGNWQRFAADKWPSLHEKSRTRWMKLSEVCAKGMLDLETEGGLLRAYRSVGLFPERAERGKVKTNDPKGGWLVHVARLVAALGHVDIEKLSAVDRSTMAERLAPVVAIHGRLVS